MVRGWTTCNIGGETGRDGFVQPGEEKAYSGSRCWLQLPKGTV